jgi:hypothetical protein
MEEAGLVDYKSLWGTIYSVVRALHKLLEGEEEDGEEEGSGRWVAWGGPVRAQAGSCSACWVPHRGGAAVPLAATATGHAWPRQAPPDAARC